MLGRKYRATRPNIEETIKTGNTIFGKFINTKISKKNHEKLGFSIIVPKKVEKTSVGRHKIKRKISSFIEKMLSKINKDSKKTVVFFAKKTDEPIDYPKVEKDVENIVSGI